MVRRRRGIEGVQKGEAQEKHSIGLAKIIHTNICTYIHYFSRVNTIHTVMYGVHIRIWSTLHTRVRHRRRTGQASGMEV
jgi:hypothetical protein